MPRPARHLAPIALASWLAALAACGSVVEEAASGATSSSSAGSGGRGCIPGTFLACYSGPPATLNVGACHSGAQTCGDDGLGFGPCEGEALPTAEDCKTPEDEDCDGAAPACPGTTAWSASFGGIGNDFAQAIAVDATGAIVVVGGFQDQITIGEDTLVSKGATDILVAKFDPAGAPIWARSVGTDGDDYVADVAIGPMNRILLTGSVTGDLEVGGGIVPANGKEDILVYELNAEGVNLMSRRFGGPEADLGYAIAVDAGGSIMVTGTFDGTVDFGPAGALVAEDEDAFLLRLSQPGLPIWVKGFGGKYGDYGGAVGVDAQGNVLLTGGFYGPVDFGTGPLVTKGYYDAFLAKFNTIGEAIWVTQIPGAAKPDSFAVPVALAVDSTGGAVIGGSLRGEVDFGLGPLVSAGGSDAFVARYDASGKPIFAKRYGGDFQYPGQPDTATDAVYGIAVDASGGVALSGSYVETIDFGGGALGKAPYGDAFLARLDPKGEHLFSEGFGSSVSFAVGMGVALTPEGTAVMTGYFTGVVDFGTGPLETSSAQESDIFLVEITP